jgi:hypothetical protein
VPGQTKIHQKATATLSYATGFFYDAPTAEVLYHLCSHLSSSFDKTPRREHKPLRCPTQEWTSVVHGRGRRELGSSGELAERYAVERHRDAVDSGGGERTSRPQSVAAGNLYRPSLAIVSRVRPIRLVFCSALSVEHHPRSRPRPARGFSIPMALTFTINGILVPSARPKLVR